MSKKVIHLATQLSTAEEQAQFRKAKKYVVGFCGPVSDAEVLRFLVRNWTGEGGIPRKKKWIPYVEGHIPQNWLVLFLKLKEMLNKLPEINLGKDKKGVQIVLSCHILCRAIARVVKDVSVVDGTYGLRWSHSWLVTKDRQWVIDAYPPGMMDAPILIDASFALAPGKILYKEEPVRAKKINFTAKSFKRAVTMVARELRKTV